MAKGTTYTTQDLDPQKGSIIEEFSYKSGKKVRDIFSSLEAFDDARQTISDYTFSEDAPVWAFIRSSLTMESRQPWRPADWTVVTPGVVLERVGHLDVLRWMRDETGCALDRTHYLAAARAGRVEVLSWLREARGVPWDASSLIAQHAAEAALQPHELARLVLAVAHRAERAEGGG